MARRGLYGQAVLGQLLEQRVPLYSLIIEKDERLVGAADGYSELVDRAAGGQVTRSVFPSTSGRLDFSA